MKRIAITRHVSPDMSDCELTHLNREAIHVETARRQHDQYEQALVSLG